MYLWLRKTIAMSITNTICLLGFNLTYWIIEELKSTILIGIKVFVKKECRKNEKVK